MLSTLRALAFPCAALAAALSAAVAAEHTDALKGYDATPTPLRPVYPESHACSPITSLYGSWIDLDGSRRETRHEGIDLGELGDVVLAPAAGVVLAIWATGHGWGEDWSVLIGHAAADLGLGDPALAYYSELDHLQAADIGWLRVGDAVRRGARIGVVRHPGANPRLRAEVHWEVYEVAAARRHDLAWEIDENGNRSWWNGSASLIDPLFLMSRAAAEPKDGKVAIAPFDPDAAPGRYRGFTYPLSCARR